MNVFTIRVHGVCAESRNPEVVSQFTSNCFPDFNNTAVRVLAMVQYLQTT